MSFSIVYADKDKIQNSIAQNIIPMESLILTNGDNKESEAFYYDENGKLKQITKRTTFGSLSEARIWASKYDYVGELISVLQNDKYVPYMIGEGNKFYSIPYKEEVILTEDTVVLDGGSAPEA